MSKDVIYIDVEDDITAIIGKIKASKDKIVALVPPKRTGVLQSAVNLRLLARHATTSHKRLVIVTNNHALIALSAAAKIPVAKNLQSEPEIAEIDALEVDDGEDIIDGSNLPIGELVKTIDHTKPDAVSQAIDTIDIEVESPIHADDESGSETMRVKNKVPDFSRFRKRLFLFIAIVPFVVAFFVWATQYAPAAKIIITAKTSSAPVSMALKLGGTTATDISKNTIQTITKQIQKDVSVDFVATGQKDLGEKATGSISIENCDSSSSITIAAGTVFVSSTGKKFVNSVAATVPGLTGSASLCRSNGTGAGVETVAVTAEQNGTAYNIAAGGYTISGISGDIYAYGTAMAGGTSRMATVVSADDIQKANLALIALSSDAIKQQLISQFTSEESVIADSFGVERAVAVSVPALDTEATDKAKLTVATTYSIIAIAKAELQAFIDDSMTKQLTNTKTQRVYSNGIDKVVLSGYFKSDQGATINLATTGQIGPNIDQASIKEQSKGMRFGDVQSQIESILGVSSVDIQFSYFWVNTVPSDDSKIEVEFVLENA